MDKHTTVPMRIELLYWDDCPSYEQTLRRLHNVLAEQQIAATVHLVEVTTEQQAEELHFPGSPTIRIDGQDLFPVPNGPYGLSCRVYHTDDGRVTPLPTQEMLAREVRNLARSHRRTPDLRTGRRTNAV